MTILTAQEIIEHLQLEPLDQEGGYFHQTYLAPDTIPASALPPYYQATEARAFGTAIYALFTPDVFSAMHRLDSDEIYHFYLGDPLEMLLLQSDGSGEIRVLGNDLRAGMQPQQLVKRQVWQGSRIRPGDYGFTLLGTTMAPAFEWAGFELGQAEPLLAQYPNFAEAIRVRLRDEPFAGHK